MNAIAFIFNLHAIACQRKVMAMIVRSVKDLGALVRDRRNHLGWSQSELASKIGVQRLWVSQFEAGKTSAHIGLVMRTLRALEMELRVGATPSSTSGGPESGLVDLDALLKENLNGVDE